MAMDRIVRWGKDAPTEDMLHEAMSSYFRDIATPIHRFAGWLIVLPGKGRWIEFHLGIDDVDVITRRADDVTCAIADGFTKLLARRFQGVLEP